MSYDLFFRTDRERPTAADLCAWLAARPHITVVGSVATYLDASTGVSFQLELGDETRPGSAPLAFTMPLPRPAAMGLVAEVELRGLVTTFDLRVFDPLPDGMPDGGWSRDAFLRGWRSANAAAHRALLRGRPDAEVHTLPAAVNAGVLSWNRSREAYADRLSAVESLPCTVRPVKLVSVPGDAHTTLTAVEWDGEPSAVPEVDLVLAAAPSAIRDVRDPGPRRCIPLVALLPWLDAFDRRPADHRFGRSGRSHVCGLAHWIADTDAAPAGLAEALRSLGTVRTLEPVAPDRVLDRDSVDSARAVFRTPAGAVPRA